MSRTAKQRATAAAIAVFIDALLTQPLSADEMVEETGLHRNTISKIIEAMRRPERRSLYIASWSQDSQNRWSIAHYAIGRKDDAPKPKMTRAEVLRRYRKRRKLGLTPCTRLERSPMAMFGSDNLCLDHYSFADHT